MNKEQSSKVTPTTVLYNLLNMDTT